ncbi:alpha/beta fold hydrolase [Halomonas sp. AOP13-D3-9]
MNDNKVRTHRLPRQDSRLLNVVDAGPIDAPVWFYCHGIPGSSNEVFMASEAGQAGEVRLIAIDRPGYGGSTPLQRYSLAEHSDDIWALADHLQIKELSLLGFSGGGVFAMAAALALKNRIKELILVGTPCVPLHNSSFKHAGELTAEVWRDALVAPHDLASRLATLTTNSELLAATLMNSLSDGEQRILNTTRAYTAFQKNLIAATQQGAIIAADSMVRDTQLMIQNWPFNLEKLATPVEIFHGKHDELVHLAHGQALASAIPDATLTVLPHSGHFDTLLNVFELRNLHN